MTQRSWRSALGCLGGFGAGFLLLSFVTILSVLPQNVSAEPRIAVTIGDSYIYPTAPVPEPWPPQHLFLPIYLSNPQDVIREAHLVFKFDNPGLLDMDPIPEMLEKSAFDGWGGSWTYSHADGRVELDWRPDTTFVVIGTDTVFLKKGQIVAKSRAPRLLMRFFIAPAAGADTTSNPVGHIWLDSGVFIGDDTLVVGSADVATSGGTVTRATGVSIPIWADIDGDGARGDMTELANFLSGTGSEPVVMLNADINADGRITWDDYRDYYAYAAITTIPEIGFTPTVTVPNPVFDCCDGLTGNVSGGQDQMVDLRDLSALIAYLVKGDAAALKCPNEANINKTGIIDLADLSLLIAYLTAGAQLPACR